MNTQKIKLNKKEIKESIKNIPITVISDCRDDNAAGRVVARIASFFPESNITFLGVKNDIEASICLVDALDAIEDRPGIILINIAPRNGEAKKWPNGTPFVEFFINKAQIFSTIDGCTLSLIQDILGRKLNLRLYNILETAPFLGISLGVQKQMINSQFRSFDFLPRLIVARIKGTELPHTIQEKKWTLPASIVFCDIFGNLKISIIFRGQFKTGQLLNFVKVGNIVISQEVKFYSRLKDVPDGNLAIVVGSSGLGEFRFLEFVIQGGSAASRFDNPPTGTQIAIE